MRSQQDLHEAMRDQFVKRQKFLVRFEQRPGIGSGRVDGSCLQGFSCFANHRILKRLSGDVPHRYESIDGLRKADGEYAVVACCAERLEIQIERTVEAVRTKKHEHIQPVEGIDQSK